MKILCTLGPASFNERAIKRLTDLDVSLFRINLSHTAAEDLADRIELIRKYTQVAICLDTEGAQVRTAKMKDGSCVIHENATLKIVNQDIPGDPTQINLYPLDIINQIRVGDFISIDFNTVLVQVIEKNESSLITKVLNGGRMGSNKAVSVDRDLRLDPLTPKDKIALKIGREHGIKHVALSFANRPSDVAEIRQHCLKDTFIISKIECQNGLQNLTDIANASDALLIDRGDLSREVAIESVPFWQKKIIKEAKACHKQVFVATNLLESMVTLPTPTRAEINDIYNTILDGADGLVLAAETAIGQYPVECATMVRKIITAHETAPDQMSTDYLVRPHGGKLILNRATVAETEAAATLPKLIVNEHILLDAEQIALGTYSPLTGFMTQADLQSVLENYKLSDGTVWTLPILFQLTQEAALNFNKGQKIALYNDNQVLHATLDITDKYEIDLDTVAQKWFGTNSKDHPGVKRLHDSGSVCLGGTINLIKRLAWPYPRYTLTPRQTRFLFNNKGWSRVVGFHSRNVAHRVHEFIQKEALTQSFADGLLISPVLGPKKKGDFRSEPILESYQLMIDEGVYAKGQAVIGGFCTYSRYSGPREAVFTALCRKNMGCSHFIIGRDHTGVADFYASDANQKLFTKLGDIGITPIFFNEVGYNPETKSYEYVQDNHKYEHISGTKVRESIIDGKTLPSWLIRENVQSLLQNKLKQKHEVFF